jgi:hypothetical protein
VVEPEDSVQTLTVTLDQVRVGLEFKARSLAPLLSLLAEVEEVQTLLLLVQVDKVVEAGALISPAQPSTPWPVKQTLVVVVVQVVVKVAPQTQLAQLVVPV